MDNNAEHATDTAPNDTSTGNPELTPSNPQVMTVNDLGSAAKRLRERQAAVYAERQKSAPVDQAPDTDDGGGDEEGSVTPERKAPASADDELETLVVNGAPMQVSRKKIREIASKNLFADERMRKAAELEKQAKEKLEQAGRQSTALPRPVLPDSLKGLSGKELITRIYNGDVDEEEFAAALDPILTAPTHESPSQDAESAPTHSVDATESPTQPRETVDAATVDSLIDQRLSARDERQQAAVAFDQLGNDPEHGETFKSWVSNPHIAGIIDSHSASLAAARPELSPAENLQEAFRLTQTTLGIAQPPRASPPNGREARQAVKRSLPPRISAPRRSEPTDTPPTLSHKEMIAQRRARMRQQKGV